MLSRLLLVVSLAALVAGGAAARSDARRMHMIDRERAHMQQQMDELDFEAQGLEELESRYGIAYPGYAGAGTTTGFSNVNVMQQPLSVGATQQWSAAAPLLPQQWSNVNEPIQLSMAQIPQNIQPNIALGAGVSQWSNVQQQPIQLGSPVLDQNWGQQAQVQQQLPLGFQQSFQQSQPIAVAPVVKPDFSQELQLTQQNLRMNIGQIESQLAPLRFGNVGSGVVSSAVTQPIVATPLATTTMPSYGLSQPTNMLGSLGAMGSYGGIALGAGSNGGAQLGTSKKTTTAQPIYAQSMVVPKIITQPILRPHSVTQPILQQQMIQQPILETRQVIQPVIRRIITQPIIRPQIYESTTIQPVLKTETVVQPKIVQQTVVTPQLENQYEEQQPITEAATTQKAQPVVQPTVSAKKQHGGLGGMMSGLFGR